jgi:hypothetical protein
MAERAVEKQTAFDFGVALLDPHAVGGSQHANHVATLPQRFHSDLAPKIETPCMVGRIEIRYGQYPHTRLILSVEARLSWRLKAPI